MNWTCLIDQLPTGSYWMRVGPRTREIPNQTQIVGVKMGCIACLITKEVVLYGTQWVNESFC